MDKKDFMALALVRLNRAEESLPIMMIFIL